MKRFALALGCAVTALTVAAFAQTGHDRVLVRHRAGPAFVMDANADGWLTREEAAAAAERMFAELDTDNDGRVGAADHQARHVEIRLESGHPAQLRQAERELERAERDAARAGRDAERAARHAERDAREVERDVERHEHRRVVIRELGELDAAAPLPPEPPEPPEPPRAPMFLMVLANTEEADLDGDGALSREEFRAQHLRFFDAGDANGDGRIRFTPPPEPPEPPEPAPAPSAPPPVRR